MSLRANIDHLSAAPGIEAVSVSSSGGPREFRGDTSWSAVLEGALSLLQKTDESTIRVVIGKHTVVVQTEKDETVAVALPTGHAIAKSLRRMIRRMSRKVRGPARVAPSVVTHAAPPMSSNVGASGATNAHPAGQAEAPEPASSPWG